MTIQILYIHGGMTFKNQKDYIQFLKNQEVSLEDRISWSGKYLKESLGASYEVIKPNFPCSDNAQYQDWKIIFEKYFSLLNNKFILIGNSLGGIFLTKYLSENKLTKTPLGLILIAPPFDGSNSTEDLAGGFKLKNDLLLIQENAQYIHFFFSKDDPVVPIDSAIKYQKKLPLAKVEILKNKNGHFQITEFPEIIEVIKNNIKTA